MSKFSFDFDDTLSNTKVQRFANLCIKAGHDVHIVTSRMSNERSGRSTWNDDLFLVAAECGITDENIHFCNLKPKHEFFLENPDFSFHLDDDKDDVDGINFHCKSNTIAIHFVDTFTDAVFSTLNNLIMYEDPVKLLNIKPDQLK